MAKTVIGLFDDSRDVESAVRDLVDAGFPRASISLLAHQGDRKISGERHEEGASPVASGAGAGATAGALVGGLGGLLVGLGALVIPGLGMLVAAGPVVAALTGAGVGAVAGGVIGALVNLGVPREEAEYYAEGVRRGGTLITLQADDERADDAARIMRRNHAVDIQDRAAQWRQGGWSGYNPNAEPLTADELARERAQANRRLAEPAVAHEDRSGAQAVLDRSPGYASRTVAEQAPTADFSAPAPAATMGTAADFSTYDPLFRRDFDTALTNVGRSYDEHIPAYRYGYSLATDSRYHGRTWEQVEPDARAYWEERNPGTWDRFSRAVRYAWETVRGR